MNSSKTCEKLLQSLRRTFDASRPSPRYTRPYRSLAVQSSRPSAISQHRQLLQWTTARSVPDRIQGPLFTRFYSIPTTATSPATNATQESQADDPPQESQADSPPAYQLVFTCKPCSARSSHQISKQGYHYGAVLITCPSCKARHVISDHLGIFSDEKIDIEEILRRKGQGVKKGVLGSDGDIEFWDEGSTSKNEPPETDIRGEK